MNYLPDSSQLSFLSGTGILPVLISPNDEESASCPNQEGEREREGFSGGKHD
jgi:hypothetical protein